MKRISCCGQWWRAAIVAASLAFLLSAVHADDAEPAPKKPAAATEKAPAEQKPADAKQADSKQADAKPAKEKPQAKTASAADPYVIPEGNDPIEMKLFLRRMQRLRSPDTSLPGILLHFARLNAVATELLNRELDEDSMLLAMQLKNSALSLANRVSSIDRSNFVEKLAKDERPAIATEATKLEFENRRSQLAEGLSSEERQKLVDDVAEKLQKPEVTLEDAGLAMNLARDFEFYDPERAAPTYSLFAKYLSDSENPEILERVDAMLASVRRLNLPGNPIEIQGTTLDGEAVNISEYKGKVVLVDFWATWCGPCIAELPNVKQNYARYHDKGFDVIGVSLDSDPEKLKTFLNENQIAWKTLYDPDPEHKAFKNVNAVQYGVTYIPNVILVDQSGNVVSIRARGEELGKLLEGLLGPAPELPATEAGETTTTTSGAQ